MKPVVAKTSILRLLTWKTILNLKNIQPGVGVGNRVLILFEMSTKLGKLLDRLIRRSIAIGCKSILDDFVDFATESALRHEKISKLG